MPVKHVAIVVTFLIGPLLSACSLYQSHGYGRVADLPPGKVETTPVTLPAAAPSISQRFRLEDASSKNEHRGIDILVPVDTPVLAAADGRVSQVSTSVLYGRQVMIDHGETDSGFRIQTRYFHLAERLVEAGQPVQRGQPIGLSGLSGMAGGFPHLHFEVHRLVDDPQPVASGVMNPQLFWIDGPGQVTCYDYRRAWPTGPAALTYPVPCLDLPWRESPDGVS